MDDIRRILVPTDFSACAAAAADAAVEFARALGGEVMLLHVVPPATLHYVGAGFSEMPHEWTEAAHRGAQEALANEARRVAWPKVRTLLRDGNTHDVILAEATAQRADMIVLGTHGRRGLAHALLGSVAERVVRLSPVPVLTVRLPRR